MTQIPPVTSIENAIRLYKTKNLIGTDDIRSLFGVSESTARRIKSVADKERKERNIPQYHRGYVDTKLAFEAWNLNIDDLSERFGYGQKKSD